MAKWGLLAAHRYLESDSGGERTIGPNGQPLRRPWRTVAPHVAAQARRHRVTRRQPVWPRPIGILFLVLAAVAALHPIDSMPGDVGAFSSARPGPTPLRLQADSPAGPHTGVPDRFVWRGAGPSGRATLVLCDAGYAEIARVDGIAGCSYPAPAGITTLLARAGTFHWFVETTAGGRVVRSPLQSCEIR